MSADPWEMTVEVGANGQPRSSAPLAPDLETIKRSILSRLDVAAEFAALGVRFTSTRVSAKGWRECWAVGRKDDVPSAAVNVNSAVYHDSGGEGATLNLWDFALTYGDFGQFRDVLKHYAGKAGVPLGKIPTHARGRIREAIYLYRDAYGSVRYAVFRYREPNGKKSFTQHPSDGRGGWKYGSGCMDGVEPLPYRLPELLASPASDLVFVVEGEKDADRLAGLGLVATTNHQGAQSTERTWPRFLEYFAGRHCVIIPDNDSGGKKHARRVAELLRPIAGSVKLLELPGLPAKGDVSDWLDAGSGPAELVALAEAAPLWKPEKANGHAGAGHEPPPVIPFPGDRGGGDPPRPSEAPDDPHRLARLFLDSTRHADGLTLRYWLEEWHRWDGGAWRATGDREVGAELTNFIKDVFDRAALDSGSQVKAVTTKLHGNVGQAMKGLALLPAERTPRQPAWLDGGGPDPVRCLATTNGILDLPAYADGRPLFFLAPTPRFFSPVNLGYAFEPEAPSPTEWLKFLADLWGDDPESIESLREWFGYLLTSDTSLQKILMVIGPRRSGKGTIGRILRALVGPRNVVAPTLSSLATQFGLSPLIGKSVALIADARLSGRADSQVIVERLLSISGEDAQTIDRKHLTPWTGELPTRFVLISNELPRLGDSSGALVGRMVLLRLTRSFYGEEDTALTSRILAELPGILLWAIVGWNRLRERGRFLQPASGQELLDELEDLTSPISAFIAERCTIADGLQVPIGDLYTAWKSWCADRGKDKPGDEQGFGKQVRSAVPSIRTRRLGSDGSRTRVYEGIGLNVRPHSGTPEDPRNAF
jgi:putative DNA primase/helicase